jgi:hypothetical protein
MKKFVIALLVLAAIGVAQAGTTRCYRSYNGDFTCYSD